MKNNIFKNMFKLNNVSNKEKLALSTTILVLFIIIMSVLSGINNDINFNYDEFKIEEAINESAVVKDRQKYFDLYEIISSYLVSYNLESDTLGMSFDYDKIKYTREEYYLVLTDKYKKQINKNQYMNISEQFCKKFLNSGKYGEYVEVNKDIINDIYLLPSKKYGQNMYICKLNTNNEKNFAYIGIHLNPIENKYSIFYIC